MGRSYTSMFKEQIEKARNGNPNAVSFLRLRMKSVSSVLPEAYLIEVCELLLKFRMNELKEEAERN